MPIIWLCMTYGNICELEQAKYVAFYYVRDTVLPSETIVCTEGVREGERDLETRWVATYSTLALDMTWIFFFSGFSNTHGVPLNWHRRHGACWMKCEPGRAEGAGHRATERGKRRGWREMKDAHLSFTSVLSFPAVRTGPRAPLWDVR